jgi:hypothetical protein
MKESLLAAIGVWLAFVLVFVSLVGAETGAAPAGGKGSAPTQSEVSGTIESIDPAGRTVPLEDGTR